MNLFSKTLFLSLSYRASLWSSCVVLPLLALTWMSAVLAITDRRSALFQILFAVFDSLEGFIIVMVHCILRREVRKDTWENINSLCNTKRKVILKYNLNEQLHFRVCNSF